jgi:exonuclease SbcD
MRLLHTADWHLGDRLGRIDRTGDIQRGVERVARYCRDEQVDVLLIAGDLFSEAARADGLRGAIEHLRDTFEPFLQSGGTILAVTGNHDNETFCQTLRHAMSLAAPTDSSPGSSARAGRFYLAAEPALIRLPNRQGGMVQFVLMPFPTATVFLSGNQARRYASLSEKNDQLRSSFLQRLAELLAGPSFDRSLPTVLMAHVGVRGADLTNRFRISEELDVVIDESSWPGTFAYVALGHIHKAQVIGGHEHVRYSGSIDRLDLGEAGECKSVVLVDVGPQGELGVPQLRPLDATPIYRVEIHDAVSDIPNLIRQYPDRESALVNLRFSYQAGRDDLFDIQRQLDSIFPRWYDRDWHDRGELGPAFTINEATAKSFETSVREYLGDELANWADGERTALLDLAERYLHEFSARPAE